MFTCILFLASCKEQIDYYSIPSYSTDDKLNAIIEIPAGTNKKLEYNKETKSFEIDRENGKDRVISFLPYLGNYGFIPSTFSDPKTGGDGDALDILILSESVKTGTVMKTIPIAMLKLIDDGEIDYKIIAIPSNKAAQIIKSDNYEMFVRDYPEVKTMIETWFLNYNKLDKAQIEGWGNEKEAIVEIKRNRGH